MRRACELVRCETLTLGASTRIWATRRLRCWTKRTADSIVDEWRAYQEMPCVLHRRWLITGAGSRRREKKRRAGPSRDVTDFSARFLLASRPTRGRFSSMVKPKFGPLVSGVDTAYRTILVSPIFRWRNIFLGQKMDHTKYPLHLLCIWMSEQCQRRMSKQCFKLKIARSCFSV